MRPSPAYLAELADRLRYQEVTYAERGQTKSALLPVGYLHQRVTAVVGRGEVAWANAREGLLRWRAHKGAGLTIYPTDALIEPGVVVIATAQFGPVCLVIPCKVIYRTDEAERFGFAYGTLPGHPERGEEAFHVTQDNEGTVRFEVVAFSRPADLVAKIGAPIGRAVQAATTRRYIEGLMRAVTTGTGMGGPAPVG